MTAKRVTEDMVEAAISNVTYHVFEEANLTVCAITMDNGYTVTGQSGCVDPAMFDPTIGRNIGFGKAKSEVWAMLGFRLADERMRDAKEANKVETGMSFQGAIDAIRAGRPAHREGWNGNDMFIFLRSGGPYPVVHDDDSGGLTHCTLKYAEQIILRTASGELVPWCPSQTDVLANDWKEA